MAVELAQERWLTAEDLMRPGMPEKNVELIRGELVEMSPAGWWHNDVGQNIVAIFRSFCKGRPGLFAAGDNYGFLISRNPDTMLSPDASIYSGERNRKYPWLPYAPRVAVEVVSPGNTKFAMDYKRSAYLDAGTEQFWLVLPEQKTVEIHFTDGRVLRAQGDAVILGEGVVEGLEIALADVFAEE